MLRVALPVSAWIEIDGRSYTFTVTSRVALPVSAWIEIFISRTTKSTSKGRTPRECVD